MSIESRKKKTETIEQLQESFTRCTIAILTDYRGLNTADMTALRRRLQESGSQYQVVKNTLARLAAENAGHDDLVSSLEGPIAIAFGYGDIIAPAKVLASYTGEAKENISIRGGFLGSRSLTAGDVITLARLPSREILLARVLGQMQSPISALLGCLTTPLRGFVGVLQARINQLEGK